MVLRRHLCGVEAAELDSNLVEGDKHRHEVTLTSRVYEPAYITTSTTEKACEGKHHRWYTVENVSGTLTKLQQEGGFTTKQTSHTHRLKATRSLSGKILARPQSSSTGAAISDSSVSLPSRCLPLVPPFFEDGVWIKMLPGCGSPLNIPSTWI